MLTDWLIEGKILCILWEKCQGSSVDINTISKIQTCIIYSLFLIYSSSDPLFILSLCCVPHRLFSKMAAENSNKSKLKTYTSTRKNNNKSRWHIHSTPTHGLASSFPAHAVGTPRDFALLNLPSQIRFPIGGNLSLTAEANRSPLYKKEINVNPSRKRNNVHNNKRHFTVLFAALHPLVYSG